jgi:hypothetical protein
MRTILEHEDRSASSTASSTSWVMSRTPGLWRGTKVGHQRLHLQPGQGIVRTSGTRTSPVEVSSKQSKDPQQVVERRCHGSVIS